MTALRCLLFSSKADTVPPIWQVLADLGIEGEHCASAVDAVERVTTQEFQIVITDWEDQPEAAFLLKTARELKAAQRPITLAIVTDEARLPEALQAGANSILVKPIRTGQVRETLGTACELLSSKLPLKSSSVEENAKMAMAAAAGSSLSRDSVFEERLDPPVEQPSLDATVQEGNRTEKTTEPAEPGVETISTTAKPEVLTGWAMLQARLTSSAPPADKPKLSRRSDLLTYDYPMDRPPKEAQATEHRTHKVLEKIGDIPDSRAESALFSYMSGEAAEKTFPLTTPQPHRRKLYALAAVAVVCIGAGAVPRTRQFVRHSYQAAVRASSRVLNPPPAPMPDTVVAHESFGQASDDYKFPAVGNIPDATTDPSQIQVLPVVDPTVKPPKNTSGGSDSDPSSPANMAPAQANPNVAGEAAPDSSTDSPKDAAPSNATETVATPAESASAPPRSLPVPTLRVQPPVQASPSHGAAVPVSGGAGIPSSLRSQIGSTVPQNSGAKPIEAAMASIEPVNLPELVERQFLLQPVEPVYPSASKAGAQKGSVTLEVLIGRDGLVQDAKFLQGSLVFARPAIDSVRQWRFKPYILNGHAVTVQSVMTLNFKPPA